MQSFTHVLSEEDITYLNSLPEVVNARDKLNAYLSHGQVYFSITLTDSLRNALHTRLGLNMTGVSHIPMRWIKGDTAHHVDVGGQRGWENTYLIYMNDSPGALVLDGNNYPIEANTAFVFNEGVPHSTQDTGSTPRLLLGPMNEYAQPVGSPLTYFPTEADALAYTNVLGYSGSFTVGSGGPFGGYSYWRLASNSTGTSSQAIVYPDGSVLNADGAYYLYPTTPCFMEGTKILCEVDGVDTYVPIEHVLPGTRVKTCRDGYKKVVIIAKGTIHNYATNERIENRLYKCSRERYPELNEDLYITGGHSILVDTITDIQRAELVNILGKIFITDNKYRLIACVDERAEPWASEGTYPIWHFALEHTDDGMNYGVYANGLLVETCAIRTLRGRTNMILI